MLMTIRPVNPLRVPRKVRLLIFRAAGRGTGSFMRLPIKTRPVMVSGNVVPG